MNPLVKVATVVVAAGIGLYFFNRKVNKMIEKYQNEPEIVLGEILAAVITSNKLEYTKYCGIFQDLQEEGKTTKKQNKRYKGIEQQFDAKFGYGE